MARLWLALLAGAVVSLAPAPAVHASSTVEGEIRVAFDAWAGALARGDKAAYLSTFWSSPRLMVRVGGVEYRGLEAYRKRLEGTPLPPGRAEDFRDVDVVAVSRDAGVVAYRRPAPSAMTGGEAITFVGTLVFVRTGDGWKVAAWHAHTEGGARPAPGHPPTRPH